MAFDLSRRAALTGALSLPFAATAAARADATPSSKSTTPVPDGATQLYPVGPWEKAIVKWHNPFRQFGFLAHTQSDAFEIFFRAKDLGVPGIYLRPGTEVFVRTYKRPNRSVPQAAAMAPNTAPEVLRAFELVSKHYGCPIGATWQPVDDNGYAKLARKTAMYLTSRISSLPIETLARSITWRSDRAISDEARNLQDWRDAIAEAEHYRANRYRSADDTEALYQSILRAGQGPLQLKIRIATKMMQTKSLVT